MAGGNATFNVAVNAELVLPPEVTRALDDLHDAFVVSLDAMQVYLKHAPNSGNGVEKMKSLIDTYSKSVQRVIEKFEGGKTDAETPQSE